MKGIRFETSGLSPMNYPSHMAPAAHMKPQKDGLDVSLESHGQDANARNALVQVLNK